MNSTKEMEILALQEFRKRLVDVLPEVDDFNRRDDSLIRWLRAREMNMDKAEEMFRNVSAEDMKNKAFLSLQYRVNNKIIKLLDWIDAEMDEKFPFYVDGIDKNGRPVFTLPFGTWDVRSLVESEGGLEKYCQYFHKMMETIMREVRRRTLDVKNCKESDTPLEGIQFVAIVDFTGYSYRQLANIKAIQAAIRTTSAFEAHYPETLSKCMVINAPAIFSILFSMTKPFITGRTMEKIQIFSGDTNEWLPAVLDLIEPTQLREQFGGSKLP